jgi:hypothetical protein
VAFLLVTFSLATQREVTRRPLRPTKPCETGATGG